MTDVRNDFGAERGAPPERLWGGRFSREPAESLEALNRSLPTDLRLWREDLDGSRAWIQALHDARVLTASELETLERGLERVGGRLAAGEGERARDEDIHSLVERLLYEEVGELAGKMHTGRSRNDQVATDTRLWMLRSGPTLDGELRLLEKALADLAAHNVDPLMPAYTHLRRAQPVRVGHWCLSHFWAFERDRARLGDALGRVGTLPLGSGAVGGSGFPVDRVLLRELLGFSDVASNSMDAVTDRDWVCEIVFAGALIGTHLARLAEDLILFSSEEFGFVRLPESHTTGSSLLPQKQNPDGLELARGKSARLAANVNAALGLLKGLSTGYHKDLQEDKTLLFETVDTLMMLLPVVRGTVAGIEFDAAALREAVDDHFLLATDLADALVRRGVPFREAHGAIGALVRRAEAEGWSLAELPPHALAAAHPAFGNGAGGEPKAAGGLQISPEASVEARCTLGGTSRGAVLEQLRQAREAIAG